MKAGQTEHSDAAAQLKHLDYVTDVLATRRPADADVIPIHPVAALRVPAPRRSRVFLRHGGGHGVFAEVTLTAPRPLPAHD